MNRRRRLRQDVEEALIRLDVESLAHGGYLATSPDVPGLVAEGRTLAETAEIAQDVARKILESCVEHGDPLPPPFRKRRSHAQSLTIPVGLPASASGTGRLAGFGYLEVARRLRRLGFEFDREAKGRHKVWRHTRDGRKATVPRHPGDIAEGTLRAVLRQANVSAAASLDA